MSDNRMQSSFQRKVNRLRKRCEFLHRKLQLANAQEQIQHNFQQYIRDNYPEIYREAVDAVKIYVDKREELKDV